jgi:acyl-CoA dehydrogenase family member 9
MLKKFSKIVKINNIHRCISSTTVRTKSAEVTQYSEKHDAIKVPGKKPQREPLAKNFFLAKIDAELMAYPEAFYENDVLNKAKLRKSSYEDFFATNIDANLNDETNIQKLKEFGSFYCTHALTTDRLFSHSEPESKILSYNYFISTHQLIAQTLTDHANEQLKLKYIPKLSSGELKGVLCFMEHKPCNIENRPFNTTAKQNEDQSWVVNGEKSYVLLNDLDSSVLLTVASIDSKDKLGDYQEKAALFLIDGRAPGVSISKVSETIGFNDQPFKRVTVKFDNVLVDESEIFYFIIYNTYIHYVF